MYRDVYMYIQNTFYYKSKKKQQEILVWKLIITQKN